MGVFSIFGGKPKDTPTVVGQTLKELQLDYIVEYLGENWLVKDLNFISFGADQAIDFHLHSDEGNELHLQYLESQDRYRVYGTDQPTAGYVPRQEMVLYKNVEYLYQKTGTGRINEDLEFSYWEYLAEEGKRFFRTEQYGEHDFTFLIGKEVDPLHFDIVGDSCED